MSLYESSVSVLSEINTSISHSSITHRNSLDFPFGLIEISGPKRFAWAARYLEKHANKPAAWIEENMENISSDVISRSLPLEKILFINGEKDSIWAAGTILRSHLFPIIVFHAPFHTEKNIKRFRRLSLAASSTMILLSEIPHLSHYFAIQYAANNNQELITLRRSKC